MQERLTFQSDGLKLSAVLHIPDTHRPGERLPAFIVCHGFVGSKDESHAQIQAEMMEKFGYAALRFDFRCCGESEGERAQVRCFDQVADAKNALTFLASRPEIDAKRIGITGHSFGAAVSVYTAGVDKRVACVISSCGWGHGERKFRGQHPTPEAWERFTGLLEKGREHKRQTGESLWISRFDAVPIPEELRKNLSPKAIMEIPTETAWSMMNFRAEDVVANIAPRPALFFHTADDIITPTEQSIRLFEKAGQAAELMLISGTAHFPLAPEDAPRTKIMIKGWLEKFFPATPAA
ncbi:alpha/beta fold hydrolase [Mesorhizobium sp. M00.F.Ca.ET.186.01.1.1]|nr:alpha/beta fold hydrolase [bacterium M00.F.Ca.ET.205.01.1.1]TGU46651.1 alpha/beta fold hydrolase [bacterium M00.F.Ca.ET.152.01.1.1]TGV31745.1 alpha/beta fold hydrolase [Mesorhizobium sp. M00.F.Ca.ET.186.01.1.1]TGZ38921.1 alpha/beta fold hydrolase [bacterium M00.F.Ca.ET.162.01.1.1]